MDTFGSTPNVHPPCFFFERASIACMERAGHPRLPLHPRLRHVPAGSTAAALLAASDSGMPLREVAAAMAARDRSASSPAAACRWPLRWRSWRCGAGARGAGEDGSGV